MYFKSRSVDGLMLDAAGRPSGFDYMRISLAVAVLVIHAYNTSTGPGSLDWTTFPHGPMKSAILPMFFALSGFLVAGSMERCRTVGKFLGLRLVRIYPALSVEVLLTAFLIGPFVTTLTLWDYFTDPGFLRYLVNVTGHITIYLPEAFLINPKPLEANLQLWTVPYELYCYIILAVLIGIGIKKDRRLAVAGTVAIFAVVVARQGIRFDWDFATRTGPMSGKMLVVAFLFGVCAYLYRKELPVSGFWITVAVVLTGVFYAIEPLDRFLPVIPLTYLTVALGVMNPPRNFVINKADYSYGIYLYHFVVQQTLIFAFGGALGWGWNLMLSLVLTTLVAALSWHLIEKPALGLRHVVNRLEASWLERRFFSRPRAVGHGE